MTIALTWLMICTTFMVSMDNTYASDTMEITGLKGLGPKEKKIDQIEGFFVMNGGQWDDSIYFAAITSFGHVAFGKDFILFDIREGAGPNGMAIGTVIKMEMIGANQVTPKGDKQLSYSTNIFHGNDPSKWGTGLETCKVILYENLWDGIDLVYRSDGSSQKYEYILDPYANLSDIRFTFFGQDSLEVGPESIKIVTPHGNALIDGDLVSFHEGASANEVKSSFIWNDDGTLGYSITGRDPSRTFVIDPLIYGTYIGGKNVEYGVDMVRDDHGACYLTGTTYSFDFPTTPGAYCTRYSGDMDGWVMKLHPDGSTPTYSTYIGGSHRDMINAIDIDSDGNVYVAGHTDSPDFPTTKGAFNETLNGSMSDIVVFKLDSLGSKLEYSTYIGGNESDIIENKGTIKVDDNRNVYVTGTSLSGNFPLTDDAIDKYNNATSYENGTIDYNRVPWRNGKVVFFKMDSSGSNLLYSTYIGGSNWDSARGIDLDQFGIVYITGSTSSYDFPVTDGAFDTSLNSWSEIFVLKFDLSNNSLIYSTFLGGREYQIVHDILVDSSGCAYVVGNTYSSDFPVKKDAYQTRIKGRNDIFVTAFDPSGSSIILSTFLGGGMAEDAYGIDLDPEGNILLTGYTESTDFPTVVTNKNDTYEMDPDMIIVKFDQNATDLIYSTIIGGSLGSNWPRDAGSVICYSGEHRVIIAGLTSSKDFPVSPDAWDNTMQGDSDVVLLKFDISFPPSAPMDFSLIRGDAFINLSWTEPEFDGGMPVIGYQIRKGIAKDEMDTIDGYTSDLFYNDTDLTMGKRYFYQIMAVNGVGTGIPTEIIDAIAASSPTPPQFFQVERGNGYVDLSWEPPVFNGYYDIDGYRIYKIVQEEEPVIIEMNPFFLYYRDENVTNGVNYTYYITAWNIIGESEPSKKCWTIPRGKPSPPAGLTLQNGTDYVFLNWNPPENNGGSEVLFYKVYIGYQASNETIWRYFNTYDTEFYDYIVEIGRCYKYYVTAVNSEGESFPSDIVLGGPHSTPSPPSDVQILEGDEYLIISWSLPTFLGGLELRGYHIYRSHGGLEFYRISELNIDQMIFRDENVTNGKQYSYRITAFNDIGESEMTKTISGTPARVPDQPSNIETTNDGKSIFIHWNAPASNGGATVLEYLIFRKEETNDFAQLETIPVNNTSFLDEEVEAGIIYTYAVKARNRMGLSQFSKESKILAVGVPGVPTDVNIISGDGLVEITWTTPAFNGGIGLRRFIIYRASPDLSDKIQIGDVEPSVFTFIDDDVTNGVEYVYSVVASNSIGDSLSVWSDPIMPLGKPGSPRALKLVADEFVVTISWQSPSDDGGSEIMFYKIYRCFDDGEAELIRIVESGTFSFKDSEKKTEGTYSYFVTAVNEIGESGVYTKESIEVTLEEESQSFFKENASLMVTIPLILILFVLIVLILIRKKPIQDTARSQEPIPMESTPIYMEPYVPIQEMVNQEDMMNNINTQTPHELSSIEKPNDEMR